MRRKLIYLAKAEGRIEFVIHELKLVAIHKIHISYFIRK